MRIVILTLIMCALLSLPVFAHQRELYEIGGKQYLMVIGSLNEPVVVDDKTGVDLRVMNADTANPTSSSAPNATPVVGLETTLQVELIAGDKKKILPLAAVHGALGSYKAPFYPTVATTYTYRVFGTINGTTVDLSFTCNPAGHPRTPDDNSTVSVGEGVSRLFKSGAFGCPSPRDDVGFPEKSPSLRELSESMQAMHGEHGESHVTGSDGQNYIAWISLAVGALALLMAAGAFLRK